MFHLQQPSHKIFDFGAFIDWFQGIVCPEMTVIDRQNQYPWADALQMRQPFTYLFHQFFHYALTAFFAATSSIMARSDIGTRSPLMSW